MPVPDSTRVSRRNRRVGLAPSTLALCLLVAAPVAAQDWHDAYRAGLAALARGDPARAVEALQRAATLRSEPGRNVLTYGTNVEPRYFPYLRLAEAQLALGRLDAAREALEKSASWGAREPADERQALAARLDAAVAARRPPPTPTATPPPPVTLATPTPAPTPTAVVEPPAAAALPQAPAAPPASSPALPPPGAASRPSTRPRTDEPVAHAPPVSASTGSLPGTLPGTGSIEVVSQPAGASVYVDDEPVGSTDPGTGRLVKSGLALGRHRVRVAHAGHEDAARELDVTGTVTFYATLRSSAAEAADSRVPLVAFAVLALAVTGLIAWIALRRPSHPARPGPASLLSGAETKAGAPATPRTFMNPGARLDEQGREWFGDYRLLEMLGRGGMASVFKAERRDELVALKRPLASFLDDRPFLDRFSREAEIGRTLNHPNIVRIIERGNVVGVPYFTMQLVPGETLLAFLRREGSAEPRLAAQIVVQVAEALDLAHGKGVVHRDLKPSNIMLLPDGSARVMDFGIARAQRFDTLTATSAFLGTPHYVAPEMIEGLGAEPRSDLYALGVVLFELVTGQRPFDADTAFGVLKKHCSEEPVAPSRLRPGVPPVIDAIVLQLLRKNAAERPANAEVLVIALRDFIHRSA